MFRTCLIAAGCLVGAQCLAQPVLLDCDRGDWLQLPPILGVQLPPRIDTADLRGACEGLPAAAGLAACDRGQCCRLGPQAASLVQGNISLLAGTSTATSLAAQLEDGAIYGVSAPGVALSPLCLGRGASTVPPPPPPAPDTAICGGPASPSADPNPAFGFGDPSGLAERFECSRDGGAWDDCTPPEETWNLPLGDGPEVHEFAVRGRTAAAGPDPSPAVWRWTHVGDLVFADQFEAPNPVPCSI